MAVGVRKPASEGLDQAGAGGSTAPEGCLYSWNTIIATGVGPAH